MFRLLGVIIRSSSELIQNYLIPSALWNPVALTIVGAIVFTRGPDDDSKESKHVFQKW